MVVKLQNKAVRIINDVPVLESITPHYGGPFWSKLNKIFNLLIELFVLAVYFILLYIYIFLPFVAPFFVTYHEFLAHPTNYFFYNVRIIFGTLSE